MKTNYTTTGLIELATNAIDAIESDVDWASALLVNEAVAIGRVIAALEADDIALREKRGTVDLEDGKLYVELQFQTRSGQVFGVVVKHY